MREISSIELGPQKKCYGNILTGDLVAAAEVDVRELHKARERAEVACVKL